MPDSLAAAAVPAAQHLRLGLQGQLRLLPGDAARAAVHACLEQL